MNLTGLTDEARRQQLGSRVETESGRGHVLEQERLSETSLDPELHGVEHEVQQQALRELREELEKTLQRYTDFYDHLPIGHMTLTRSGQIVQANPTAAQTLRRERQQLAGAYIGWYLDAFDAGRFAAHLETCLETGAPQELEVTLRLDNGLLLTVQLCSRVAPIDSDGQRHLYTAITSVSKLKQAQAVMSDIEREQATLSHSIAHDLRGPLVTISNFARQILKDESSLPSEIKTMVERMECAAVRMENTLQHLVEFCSLGAEALSLDPVNLEELVQQVIMEHREMIQQRGGNIIVERPLPCVRGARLMLAQVLTNILSGALKYQSSGAAPTVRISAVVEDPVVRLKIAEQGTDSSAEEREQRFRVFERLYGYNNSVGNGVGFALVCRAIERMNGRVWIESDLEKGPCFNLELPNV